MRRLFEHPRASQPRRFPLGAELWARLSAVRIASLGAWAKESPLRPLLFAESAPVDLRILGRMLTHAAVLGALAGLFGVLFLAALEQAQHLALEHAAGYTLLRAAGERFSDPSDLGAYVPWALALIPAIGGLLAGLVMRAAHEARGGGGDAMIEAFHERSGFIRPRVLGVKALASLLTLGSGGSGGREGPTMLIGGSLGSLVGGLFRVGPRERRILMVAGVAAGISAVFRTPLGAALIAVEVLYRDGFESEALVPSVFSSVVAYSVVSTVLGEGRLFEVASRMPFRPAHLPLYGALAISVAGLAVLFLAVMRRARALFRELPVPDWARPGIGGLGLGVFVVSVLALLAGHVQREGQGLGILGGGYGAVQVAITGAPWLPDGWRAVALLVFLALAKIVATSLTIGSGGSAGDFAPSLTIGGLFGGAFGRALQLLGFEGIDPGSFALVGMGAFYGGVAHVPLSALVMVCELAGNYDLLVPLMLALGVSFVALKNRTLYPAQLFSPAEAQARRSREVAARLSRFRVRDVITPRASFATFRPATSTEEMIRACGSSTWQDVFPVLDGERMVGLVSAEALRVLAAERDHLEAVVASDVALPPVFVGESDNLATAAEAIVKHGLREVPVLDARGAIVGFLDEADATRTYLDMTTGATPGEKDTEEEALSVQLARTAARGAGSAR